MLRYLVICSAFFVLNSASRVPFKETFRWNYINYTWPSEEAYSGAKSDGSYIEKNNIISGIRFWKDKMYLTVPRYKNGVPVTLASISATAQNNITDPLLEPYPSWELQKIGDCSALQNAKNIEIDPKGRMWVLDNGRVETMTSEPKNNCPPRLVILDLENNGKVLKSYEFPEEVVSASTGFLKNIAIDHQNGGVAYISDSDEANTGLIVYSLANNTSWKVYHESMNRLPEASTYTVHDMNFNLKGSLDGVALSPASTENTDRDVYFSPLASYILYAVKTKALIDAKDKEGEERKNEIGKHIRTFGRKAPQTDGMIMSNTGILYTGAVDDDAVNTWDTNTDATPVVAHRIVRDRRLMQWPSNFAFDDKGALFCVANRMHLYINDKIEIDQPNYRVMKAEMNTPSYLYTPDGKAPEWPEIKSSSSGGIGISRLG